jgi:serine/threonine protein kinase
MPQLFTQDGTLLQIDDTAEIHRGGEGRIMLLTELPNAVAKLYFDPKRAISLAQMLALSVLDKRYFVVPQALIYDKPLHDPQKQVVGFAMPYLDNQAHIPLSALFSAAYCQKNAITYATKIDILRHIALAISAAHAQNIVIGDLSGLNILLHLPNYHPQFIDTDSYQSAAHRHSGVLFDDIRDYLYGGTISPHSDYFAFAVIAFQLLASAHPFRGTHRRFAHLSERIIQRLPIFATDPDLVPPKCYVPIAAPNLQAQFDAIFRQGKRQLLSLTDADIAPQNTHILPQYQQTQPNPLVILPSNAPSTLRIQQLIQLADDEYIVHCHALTRRFCLQTNKRYLVFEAQNQAFTRLTHQFDAALFSKLWIGEQQIVAQQQQQIVQVQDNGNTTHLHNINLSANSRLVQYGNIMAVIEPDYLKQWHLDDINGGFMRQEQTRIFGKSFYCSDTAIWQQTSGKYYLFYRSGNALSSVYCSQAISNLWLCGTHGIMSYRYITQGVEKQKHVWGAIQHLQWQPNALELSTPKQVAYRALQKGQGLLFEPADDVLMVRRTEDFALLQSINCKALSEQSQLYYTESGIIAIEGNSVLLINTQ